MTNGSGYFFREAFLFGPGLPVAIGPPHLAGLFVQKSVPCPYLHDPEGAAQAENGSLLTAESPPVHANLCPVHLILYGQPSLPHANAPTAASPSSVV